MADVPLQVTIPTVPPVSQAEDSHAQVVVPIGGGDSTPPTIDNFTPAVGTPLQRTDSVAFDVKDLSGLLRVQIQVKLGNDVPVVVHDGDRYVGQFSNLSTRTAITNGFRYTVKRNGGWVKAPVFSLHAVDTDGNEA